MSGNTRLSKAGFSKMPVSSMLVLGVSNPHHHEGDRHGRPSYVLVLVYAIRPQSGRGTAQPPSLAGPEAATPAMPRLGCPSAIGAHDEIFQVGQPVLVGVDTASNYCYLLSLEDHRDAETWDVRLLELVDQGFAPDATVADAGTGLRPAKPWPCPRSPAEATSSTSSVILSSLSGSWRTVPMRPCTVPNDVNDSARPLGGTTRGGVPNQ